MLTALIGLPDGDRFRDAFRTATIAWREWLRARFSNVGDDVSVIYYLLEDISADLT